MFSGWWMDWEVGKGSRLIWLKKWMWMLGKEAKGKGREG